MAIPSDQVQGEIISVSVREVISRRVWWKPWTWLLKPIHIEYIPTTETLESWKAKQWVVTDNNNFRRIIYVNYFTPRTLAALGFHGNYEDIVIFPYEEES